MAIIPFFFTYQNSVLFLQLWDQTNQIQSEIENSVDRITMDCQRSQNRQISQFCKLIHVVDIIHMQVQ